MPPPGVGEFFWGGVIGAAFWISPADELFAILMIQAPEHREYFRALFRTLVNGAIA
jgi:CubicO group peptidase (beta-lactamase class C family)